MSHSEKESAKENKLFQVLFGIFCSLLAGTLIGILLVVFYPDQAPVKKSDQYQVADNGYSGNSTQEKLAPVVLNENLQKTAESAQKTVVTVMVDVPYETVFGTELGAAIGSSVVYRIQGDTVYLITNAHVVEGATSVYLYFDDMHMTEAQIQGQDPEEDLAVLKVKKSDLPPEEFTNMKEAVWGNSDNVTTGDTCMVIGCPYSMDYGDSVTLGIISGTEREISYDGKTVRVIQTDAAINPGNSGGAVVDTQGRLIGISSAKVKMNSVEGMGFFIPSNTVKEIVENLIESGSVDHASLGIASFDMISETMADIYQVPVGLLVHQVQPGTKAAAAGIQVGDIITAIDGEELHSLEDLDKILDLHQIGDVVKLTILRGKNYDKTVTIDLTLVSSQNPEQEPGSFFNNH